MPYPPLAPLFFIHLHHFAATLTLRLVIITLVAAWLARDTTLASSVHSLQEMTDADEGRKTPSCVLRAI